MPKQKVTTEKQLTLDEFEQQLRAKAQAGDAVASFQLVEHFERKGIATNQLEAQARIGLLTQASNQKLGAASLLLGRWYLLGHYVKKEVARAILFFEHAANQCKESYGFYQLAEIFQTGIGVQAQPEKGLNYLKKAVEMKNPDAIFTYATQILEKEIDRAFDLLKHNYVQHRHVRSLLLINESHAFDDTKVMQFLVAEQTDGFVGALLAARYLQQENLQLAKVVAEASASQEHPVGNFVRALVELRQPDADPKLAHQYMLKAAQLGHIEASYHAALAILESASDHEAAQQNEMQKHAMQLLSQAAHAGFAPAQFSFGQCWLQGVLLEQNSKEGLMWIERAAQQGHVDAIFTLALNLPVDHAQHLPLLKTAAEAGHPRALLCMGIYQQNHQNPVEAFTWFEHAKQRGEPRANYLLAVAYRDGIGAETDSKKAVELFKIAADHQDVDAYYALYQAYRDGSGVRRNKKAQEKYLKLAQAAQHPAALAETI